MAARSRSGLPADPILREAVARLVARFQPARIVLFGSRAWGEPHAESGYDLLVLVDGPVHPRKVAGAMRWELVDLPASFDIVVRPVEWWNEHANLPYSLEQRIEREGTELHAAA